LLCQEEALSGGSVALHRSGVALGDNPGDRDIAGRSPIRDAGHGGRRRK